VLDPPSDDLPGGGDPGHQLQESLPWPLDARWKHAGMTNKKKPPDFFGGLKIKNPIL
jgi:hypothetical protein